MITRVQIIARTISLRYVKKELDETRSTEVEYTLRFERNTSRYRGVEPTVLVALVGVAGTALGALVTGLLKIASQKYEGYLEISGKDWSVKVPTTVTHDELERLIGLAQSRVIEKIEIV
jgi:hypothetical protein